MLCGLSQTESPKELTIFKFTRRLISPITDRSMRYLAVFSLLFISVFSKAQEDALNFYGDVMLNATKVENKAFAADQFKDLLHKRLSKSNSFSDNLRDVQWISKLYPIDSTFRILSYQVEVAENEFMAYGYIQKSDGTLIQLDDQSKELGEDAAYMQLDQDNWMGALYYNIMEFENDGKVQYLLFGYDGYSEYDRRKVVDVLQEINGNEVVFGNEVFSKEVEGKRAEKMNRILITYSADSNVTMNYDPSLDMIVHQRLIARMGTLPGQGGTHVSDGVLVGYQYIKDLWVFTDDLFNDVIVPDEAPRPQPVFGEKKEVGIFGRKEKEKKKRPKN